MTGLGVLLAIVASPMAEGYAKSPQASQPTHQVVVEEKLPVPMRDGVKLAAKVYRPAAQGKFPTLLMRRYWQIGDEEARYFAPRGYAVALVDSRGRGASEGEWELYVHEPNDGFDT